MYKCFTCSHYSIMIIIIIIKIIIMITIIFILILARINYQRELLSDSIPKILLHRRQALSLVVLFLKDLLHLKGLLIQVVHFHPTTTAFWGSLIDDYLSASLRSLYSCFDFHLLYNLGSCSGLSFCWEGLIVEGGVFIQTIDFLLKFSTCISYVRMMMMIMAR